MVKISRIKDPGNVPIELLGNIRPADYRELRMGPTEPEQAIADSITSSKYCYVARDKGFRLLAVFGIADGALGLGTPVWFLGTMYAYRHNRAMVHYGKEYCERWIAEVGPLCNFIWEGNAPALRYIRHLGAELLAPVPLGKHGEIFYPFVLKEVKK